MCLVFWALPYFINGVVIPVPFIDQAIRLGGGLGRGWPLAAGIVLALMTLPTIIITSRAALAAVPVTRSGRAALAVGATPLQAVNHHVLPMAGPGILTGSIIGLAQATRRNGAAPADRHGRLHRRDAGGRG